MKKFFTTCLFIISVYSSFSFHVVGYFPTWIYFNATDIEYEKFTHINLSFVNPNSSGVLSSDNQNKFSSIVTEARKYETKVLFSIGGAAANNTWKNNPQFMAEETRGEMIQNLLDYCELYDFDGIDVDIEGDNLGNPDYPYFLYDLTLAFQSRGKLVTAALAPNYQTAKVTGNDTEVFQYLDFINIMSYDYAGPWSGPGQHAPFNVVASGVKFFTDRGVLAENLVLGVPFYGYDFDRGGAYTSYRTIVAQNPGAENSDQVGEIYYNGIPTMQRKTQYAIDNLGGVMIWEISQDASGDASLLDAMYSLTEPVMSVSDESKTVEFTYNNPVSTQLRLESAENIQSVSIYSITGQLVSSTDVIANNFAYDLSEQESGIYIVELNFQGGSERIKVIKQ